MSVSRIGFWSVVISYVCWGFMPLYTRQFTDVSLLEFFAHRIIWSAALLIVMMLFQAKLRHLFENLNFKRIGLYFFSGSLVASNWYLFVWGILRGDITEASLGYFINPLVSVVLGVIILREKLRIPQMISILIVAIGVGLLGFAYGKFPWLAISLGTSFGLYGLFRKMGDLNALEALTLEMILLLPFMIVIVAYLYLHQQLIFGTEGLLINLKLMSIGAITAIPLLFFIYGVQRISMTTLGIVQYLGPTLQFMSGIIFFHEIIDSHRLIGYSTVWFGLVIFALEGVLYSRRTHYEQLRAVMMD